jgi:ABC-type amino acid transport substrate-binding protein
MDSIKAVKFFLPAALILLLGMVVWQARAQDPTPTSPAPTLTPPTLVPTQESDLLATAEQSGIYTLQAEGILRVGARYNQTPFSYLDEYGVLTGYEVEVMESIGVELGVQIEWVQVTAETEAEELRVGRVDALIGEQTHRRPAEAEREFSHPYYLNQQRMVVLETAPYFSFQDMNGAIIGVAEGSQAQIALEAYAVYGWQVQTFFTEADALDALAAGQVAGMAGELDDLSRAGRQGMRFIEQPLQLDPYAIAIRKYDVNLRNALNRSIQRLFASGRLDEIYSRWFPNELDFDVLVPVYEGVFEDSRGVNQMNTDMPRPEVSLIDIINTGGTLNVAGLSLNPSAPTYDRLLDPFNQAIMDELGRRWGVTLNYLPDSAQNSVEYLVDGRAQIAVGVLPRWDGADRFDYSRPYAVRTERLMVLEGSRFQSFRQFRGGSVMGFWYEDPGDKARIEQIAEALRVNTTAYEFRSHDEIVSQFNNRNVDGIFGDNIRLRAIQEVTRDSGLPWVIVPDEEYSRTPVVFALPRNDADFRILLDWTIQEMFLDGTYQQIYNTTYGEGQPLTMLTWPGDGAWLQGEE